MVFQVVKDKQGNFRVKNTTTGKIGRDKFRKRENAEIQKKNRERFIKLIQKTSKTEKSKKDKKK
jgi:uncharacterized protein YegP (UPF0339 family)